jgi:hypothetical protein
MSFITGETKKNKHMMIPFHPGPILPVPVRVVIFDPFARHFTDGDSD